MSGLSAVAVDLFSANRDNALLRALVLQRESAARDAQTKKKIPEVRRAKKSLTERFGPLLARDATPYPPIGIIAHDAWFTPFPAPTHIQSGACRLP